MFLKSQHEFLRLVKEQVMSLGIEVGVVLIGMEIPSGKLHLPNVYSALRRAVIHRHREIAALLYHDTDDIRIRWCGDFPRCEDSNL